MMSDNQLMMSDNQLMMSDNKLVMSDNQLVMSHNQLVRRLRSADRVNAPPSGLGNVVPREGPEDARPLAGADEPPIITLLHDVDHVALLQLDLVLVLRLVVVQGTVPGRGEGERRGPG